MGRVDSSTSRFEGLVDETWWFDGEEAIAEFVY